MSTIKEIKATMTDDFISNDTIIEKYGLDTSKTFDQQFSSVSIESILFYIVAVAIWTLEQLFTQHKSEVSDMLDERTPHTLKWYRRLALAFRFGYELDEDTDEYSEDAQKDDTAAIVTYAAVSKGSGELVIKVAKGGDNLEKLDADELTDFKTYMGKCTDAGVQLNVISKDADRLQLVLDVYYDPMVLDGDGKRLDSDNDTPLQDAIANYLQNLTFDGYFSLTDLTDALQEVEGVESPRVVSAQTKWGDYDWESVTNKYRPEAGWLKIYDADSDLTITWNANLSE